MSAASISSPQVFTSAMQRYGRFRIDRQIGEGGMGVVYAAHDEQLDRPVAIKTLRGASADATARERLLQEARAAASLNHPNVCQLYELGEHAGEIYLAMELLEGESLAARLARGVLAVSEALNIELQVLAALDALHRRGLVHRDLKPSNIFLTPFGVKLLDFGLARPMLAADGVRLTLTNTQTLTGTPHYLAPKQLQGEPGDQRTDLLAAGAVLFEMLARQPPFGAGARTIAQVFQSILTDKPPALGGGPTIAAVDRVIHRALLKDPALRYGSAAAMSDDIRAALLVMDAGQVARAQRLQRVIVLPFRILRSDPDTDFLAFSLADAITSSLSSLESLVVRSSVTASRFAAETPDLQELADKADVDLVLTGTLLRAGDQIRVNTQLIEAPGSAVVTSHSSQIPLGDVFALQDELTRRVVSALSLPLSAGDEQRLRQNVPASAKAYEFYLRANELATHPGNWAVARGLYLQCLEEDPGYAPAWARLGRVNRVLGSYSGQQSQSYRRESEAAFKWALELNPDLSLAHNLYSQLEVELGHAEDAVLRLVRRAHEHTGDPELFAGLVQACRYCGLLDASIAAFEHAQRLDPHIRTSVAHAYLAAGDYERTIATDLEEPPILSAYALGALGRPDEAVKLLQQCDDMAMPRLYQSYISTVRWLLAGNRAAAREAIESLSGPISVRDPCAAYYTARAFAYLGDTGAALSRLEHSVRGGFFCFPGWSVIPGSTRSDPNPASVSSWKRQRPAIARLPRRLPVQEATDCWG